MEQGIIKPKTQRHGRFLKAREFKVHENDKTALLIKGGNANKNMTAVLKDMYMMKKPNAIMFNKRNALRPFEDTTSIEFLSKKNDSSLFMFGSHSKKRPNNLVIGRLYNYQMLDMMELAVDNFQSMADIKSTKAALGSKPCLVFSGRDFDSDFHLIRLKSLLVDFFRGPVVENVRLSGLEHVIQFTAIGGKILMRSYGIVLKKSGKRVPRVELEVMGPNMDLTLRRSHLAADQLYKQACRKPRAAIVKKTKNISFDAFGAKHGRVHMQKQDLGKLQTRKTKALKRKLHNDEDDDVSSPKQPTTTTDDLSDME